MATICSIRRTSVSYQPWLVRNINTVRSNKAAVSIQLKETPSRDNKISGDRDLEWENAKPYKEMPGLQSLPVIGTSWIFFPIVGKVVSHIRNWYFKTLSNNEF